MKEEKRRADWEFNHAIITTEYLKIAKKNGKRPTISELVVATELSHTAIEQHLNDLSKMPLKDRFKDMQLYTGDLLSGLYKHGKKGKAGCAKLFLQVVEDFTEKKTVKIASLESMTEEELKAKEKALIIEESELDNGNQDD